MTTKAIRVQLLILTLYVSGSSASADTIQVDPSSTTVTVGETFSLDVDVSNISDLYAYQFDLTFTPGVLFATNVSEGPFLANGGDTFFLPGTIDNVGGTITFNADTLIGATSGVTGSGTLAVFDFEALAAGPSPVAIANVFLLDSTGASIIPSSTGESIVTVQNASSVPEPASGALLGTALVGLLMYRRRHASCERQ
jgi:hypothetical protein